MCFGKTVLIDFALATARYSEFNERDAINFYLNAFNRTHRREQCVNSSGWGDDVPESECWM